MTGIGGVLVLNAGSSSLKYQLVHPDTEEVTADGIAERIGEAGSTLTHVQDGQTETIEVPIADHQEAMKQVIDAFSSRGTNLASSGLCAVGHRVAHGGRSFYRPTLIDDAVITEIDEISPLAPLHNPVNLIGIRAAMEMLPSVPGVAVFDTAFFHSLPDAASTYAIDRDVAREHGIRRYGFHGTSHEYVSRQAAEFLGRDTADLNQIVLHLGNGASVSAIAGGSPVDTSMGLTPLEGLVMGTRSGDLDPGLIVHLQRTAGLDADDIDDLLNKRSGLRGLCGENDFRTIMVNIEAGDRDARLAYDVYVHRLRRYIGAYMIELGRVDAITFTAGVGENSAPLRADALAGLQTYGIIVDPERNAVRSDQPRRISADDATVQVLVVPTNEELAIARQAAEVIGS